MEAKGRKKPVFSARNITKTFPGVKAIDQVNFDVYAGTVTALMGENGAGKSTLVKILSGVYQDYQGSLLLDGKEVRFQNPRHAQDSGVAIIHQELNLIPYLNISENIFLGREQLTPLGFVDKRRMRRETVQILAKLNIELNPRAKITDLRVGQQQVVEIAKALLVESRIIIMDEPTSAISDREAEILFSLIETLTEKGVAIVYITHKMDEVFRIADRVTILRDGQEIDSDEISNYNEDKLIRNMIGREIGDFFANVKTPSQAEVLRVENLSLPHPSRDGDFLVENVSLHVHAGEVLGIFGLMGAGRTELLESIFGVHSQNISGKVQIMGRQVDINTPFEAIQAGIALVPEDRKESGLVQMMSVAENISLASIGQIEKWQLLIDRREEELCQSYIKQLRIKTPTSRQPVEKLSGGNQQKVVLAKWLATRPGVLLLDEPTRGIDVNAKNEIYLLINQLTAAGMAIIFVSSELPEIMSISNRIIVLSEARLSAEFEREDATEETLLKAALPRSA